MKQCSYIQYRPVRKTKIPANVHDVPIYQTYCSPNIHVYGSLYVHVRISRHIAIRYSYLAHSCSFIVTKWPGIVMQFFLPLLGTQLVTQSLSTYRRPIQLLQLLQHARALECAHDNVCCPQPKLIYLVLLSDCLQVFISAGEDLAFSDTQGTYSQFSTALPVCILTYTRIKLRYNII